MKRLLMVLLLVPAATWAQPYITEEWTAYCENGVEKLKFQVTVDFYYGQTVLTDDMAGYLYSASPDGCVNGCGGSSIAVRTHLGAAVWRWTWNGLPRLCFQSQAWRVAEIWYGVETPDGHDPRVFYFSCSDGPQPIIDNVDCSPLPIASTTWGAIKALYR